MRRREFVPRRHARATRCPVDALPADKRVEELFTGEGVKVSRFGGEGTSVKRNREEAIVSEENIFADMYARGVTPWDSTVPSAELVRALDAGRLTGKTALEIGCSTGTNAIELARRGFAVTAVDYVAQAIEAAREKAQRANVTIDFRHADILTGDLDGPYDIMFDRGVYHHVRRVDLVAFQKFLRRVLRPGSWWLSLAGSAKESHENGPRPSTNTRSALSWANCSTLWSCANFDSSRTTAIFVRWRGRS